MATTTISNRNNRRETMCDPVISGYIQDIVANFVSEQRMFTAFDVTLEIRNNVGRGVNVRHAEIKNDIHKEMAQHLDGDWNKSSQDIGASVQAFVYYHFMSDPTTYESQTGNKPAKPSAPTSDGTTASVASSDAFAVDGRSRLLIPASFMQHLGVSGGDTVRVYKELDFILVSKEDVQLRELSSIQVDNHGYLYLSAKILGQGDLGDAQNFDVNAIGTTIEVKKA